MSTRGYCLFCLESVQPVGHLDTTKTFIKFLQQYTQVDVLGSLLAELKLSKISPILVLDCCEKCQQPVTEFCTVYQKIKNLERQLDFKLNSLVNSIDQSDKSAYKWQRSRELLANIFYNDMDREIKCKLMIREFRENIKTGRHKLSERILEGLMETDGLADKKITCRDDTKNDEGAATLTDKFGTSVFPDGSLEQSKLEYDDITDEENEEVGFPFDRLPIRQEHLSDNLDKTTSSCSQCERSFKSKKQLQMHIIYKHTEPGLPCSHCKKKFHKNVQLNKHMKIHQNPDEWKLECKVCQQKFAVQKKLTRHMKIHLRLQKKTLESIPNVDLIEPASQQEEAQSLTSSVIDKEKGCTNDDEVDNIKCEECGERFQTKDALEMHSAAHSIVLN